MSTVPAAPAIELWQSSTSSARVVESDDPGGFYCEHCFYVAQRAAADVDSVVVDRGAPLVGFLHVAKDDASASADVVGDQAARHTDTIAVIAAVLQEWLPLVENQARLDNHEPMSVLLSGYGEWGTVKNNPTGDLVRHAENLDAIADAVVGGVFIRPLVLAVDDTAIDGGAASIQAAIIRHRPHVVISLGMHSTGADHFAEHHASDRGLVETTGGFRRDPERPARRRLPSNRALAHALLRARRPLV